jgi:hypothetical protein
MPDERERGPARSRWTSFMADPRDEKPRILYEQGNPAHRLRVEHDQETLLVHLSDEDGGGWTVLAVDRATRRWVVSQAPSPAGRGAGRVSPALRRIELRVRCA